MNTVLENIKTLYEFGESGQYQIIKKAIFVIDNALLFGYSSKQCIDRLMDTGVKHLELGVAVCISLTRIDPKILSDIDKELREIYLVKYADMIADFERIEKQEE